MRNKFFTFEDLNFDENKHVGIFIFSNKYGVKVTRKKRYCYIVTKMFWEQVNQFGLKELTPLYDGNEKLLTKSEVTEYMIELQKKPRFYVHKDDPGEPGPKGE